MKSTSQTRVAVIAVLSLLLLLALVAGAQAAAAAHFSDGSAATTPAAGTQGRGGIDASQVDAIAATTPAAGTQGRGGVDASQLDAIAASSSAAGTTASAGSVARTFSHGRGAFPLPQAGTPPTATLTPSSTGSSVGVGLAALGAVLAAAAIALWAMSRRRTSRSEARDASYCASHPSDPICGAG